MFWGNFHVELFKAIRPCGHPCNSKVWDPASIGMSSSYLFLSRYYGLNHSFLYRPPNTRPLRMPVGWSSFVRNWRRERGTLCQMLPWGEQGSFLYFCIYVFVVVIKALILYFCICVFVVVNKPLILCLCICSYVSSRWSISLSWAL